MCTKLLFVNANCEETSLFLLLLICDVLSFVFEPVKIARARNCAYMFSKEKVPKVTTKISFLAYFKPSLAQHMSTVLRLLL